MERGERITGRLKFKKVNYGPQGEKADAVVKIKGSTWNLCKQVADKEFRTIPEQIEWWASKSFGAMTEGKWLDPSGYEVIEEESTEGEAS